ncbi:hypothetical protein [Neptunomonas sp.]|uniref:hypothetical protein n=1 Tax=Neptunomonas sp. TaxID=1971898 RepID=UPI0025E4F667|nr:hypothetical protein [Neptunomonas sp.]
MIDAFDELAKVDKTGIHKLLANISKVNPSHVIISSRSSEWDNSATSTFEQFIGHIPLVVRLCEFDDAEQQSIFTNYTKTDDFVEFKAEVTRFSLEPLLPNPQFLKMFADAYIESNGHFTDKRSIFTQAVTHLARETNTNVKSDLALSSDKKINLCSEVFAKLLLSGAEGVAISEANENRSYPLIASLLNSCDVDVKNFLATRLFKPGDNTDQHRPVHKIVSEYCAADYLINRISTPSDPLTLAQCLPIIAPNASVRDELRGLLGWMATLGNKPIEEAAIELDSYAVLANGDPSQLDPSSKRLLLSKLKEVEAIDPYFRRGDFWRRFSVAGFFTQEVVEEIKPVISDGTDGHLRDLLLELLVGSNATKWLVAELRQVFLASSGSKSTRMLAMKCLVGVESYDSRLDLDDLIVESSNTSLNMAGEVIKTLGPETFKPSELELFFRSCASLYHSRKNRFESTIGVRYFVKHLISCLPLEAIEYLLDSLSKDLDCTCGKKAYECDCRTGKSKIIGSLLDRYFEQAKPPFEPLRVWQWIEHLNFPNQINSKVTNSVKSLREGNDLRHGIIAHVFRDLTDREQIFQIKIDKFSGYCSHAGLRLSLDDYKFIVDIAFERDNTELWSSFLARHQYHRAKEHFGPDYLRRHMRKQASNKPEFMRIWGLLNRQQAIQDKQDDRKWNVKHRRSMKRQDRKEGDIRKDNIQYVQDNRSLVEGGKHWSCLIHFAELVLENPDKIEQEFGDENLVRNALRNCLDFIEPEVPNLQKLAELQCASRSLHVEVILFAACVEIMREQGNLEGIKPPLLIALRTNFNMGYSAVDEDERNALKAEVDRLIFPDIEAAEQFLRRYIEPQLADPECSHPEVDLLKYDELFSPLRAKLSIEWLERFDKITPYAQNLLFKIAAQSEEEEELNKIILVRCTELLSEQLVKTDDIFKQRCEFWFSRAFCFLSLESAEPYWNWLKRDRNSVFLFTERFSRMNRSGYLYWPELTSLKVEAILTAFFNEWPKLYLPTSHGTGSPSGETAYRFLTEIIWSIGKDSSDKAIPVLRRLLADPRFVDIHRELKSIQAEQLRKNALRDFEPPTPQKIVDLLDNNAVVTVEGLRQLILQELASYQKDIDGGEFNAVNRFYTKVKEGNDIHLNEVGSVEIIAERLDLVLKSQSIVVTSEHQTKNQNRIDITAAKIIDGKRRLLVIEAKGQWHSELYSAASTQLYERYSIHPDAAQQGIYLVIWFGATEKVAGKKRHEITSAMELRKAIEETLSPELKGSIDVFVLDVSRI